MIADCQLPIADLTKESPSFSFALSIVILSGATRGM